jgi:hypothetical protein
LWSFNGKQGTELADVIVNKIKQAVNAVCPVLMDSAHDGLLRDFPR